MPQDRSLLRQVKASAGSGKTHALTRAYLDLLRGAGEGQGPAACGRVAAQGWSWPEILAVTFTNRAATEMKERVLKSLKAAALSLDEGDPAPGFTPAQASRTLERILRRYHRLNIRTIDSLLNLVLKLFALEEGIAPDFELAFDQRQVYEPVYARFLARCEEPGNERALFAAALEVMVRQENKRGFDLSGAVRDRLFALITQVRGSGAHLLDDPQAIAALLTGPWTAFREAVWNMAALAHLAGLTLNKHFQGYLQKGQAAALFDGPPASAMIAKPGLADCVLMASRNKITDRAEGAYTALQQAHARYARDQAVLKGAYVLLPCLRMATALLAEVRAHEAAAGVVVGSALAAQAGARLALGEGVSDAYCRMGGRLMHLLIDEFQDTGRDQWAALAPLAEECLAKGGSLFYVGDVKQAIYGWRGGDSGLFEEVLDSPLAALAEPSREGLPCNWRSRAAVVGFNNAFFSALARPATAGELARALLGDASQEAVLDMAEDLVRAFQGCAQDLPPDRDREGGYVRLAPLPGLDADEAAEACSELEYLVKDLLARRPPRDLAVLVRSNAQAALACDRLLTAGIPVVTEMSLRLADHPVVRRLTAFLAFLDLPLDDVALVQFVSGPEVFGDEAGIPPEEVHEWLCRRGPGPAYKSFEREFPGAWARLVEPFFRRAGLMGVYDLACEAVRAFRVLERRPADELYVRRFLEVVCLAERGGRTTPAAFLEYWAESGGEEKVALPEGLNAVRIMTIHKAKGLQFPVVIVPFHGFSLSPDRDFEVVAVPGGAVLAPMAKGLGAPYEASLGRSARETLNLLYVAWTRAEEELYGFLPPDLTDRNKPGGPALAAVALVLGPELRKKGLVERGVRPRSAGDLYEPPARPRAETPPPAGTDPVDLMGWLPRLRVYRHFLGQDPEPERVRGELAHKALEFLRPGPDGDLGPSWVVQAVSRALEGVPDPAPGLPDELSAMLAWVLDQPDLPDFLARGLPEAEIMDGQGRFHRADLLVRGPRETVVLEYKTGGVQPEHRAQLRRYLGLVAAGSDAGRPVRGLLVYLDQRRTEPVGLEDRP